MFALCFQLLYITTTQEALIESDKRLLFNALTFNRKYNSTHSSVDMFKAATWVTTQLY